ncbi:marine proteobacterial sortase target protein [Aliiglaciecola sp. M165]|uniref:marine proteobacterial sortase target protein n=1 Tax=Aliiglaciecola sp. M165 TaxID=2593649 RepID=UPI001180C835|nr:marine proteobacterial sortase target protein [Aliiglaciecola sp. M165]TRY33104.1 marine proteobacterial sortase target protein [Aliiglaciecola sp. M165]
MVRRLRFVIVLLLLTLIGAVQFALPLIRGESNAQEQSSFKIDVSYESVSTHSPPVYVDNYQHVEQGSFFLQQEGGSGYQLSPLLDTKVDINITGLIARARVTQKFTNTSDEWMNGIYVFPLPENAAVDHLQMRIGDRTIEGQIHPKKKAKAIYQQAKREGKKASLLVQERPNLFKNSVANIGPGESIIVTIEYQQAVQYDTDTFSLRFPTTITPRYLPLVDADNVEIAKNGWGMTEPVYQAQQTSDTSPQSYKNENEADKNEVHGQATLNKVAMNVTLNMGFELARIDSVHHPILQSDKGNGRYEVSLQESMIANQDFVLNWQAKQANRPLAGHFVQQTPEGHFGMIMLMPPNTQSTEANLSREVMFVIDTSGSMSGESMQQAKDALSYAVLNLPTSDTFNIVEFDSHAKKLWPTAKHATDDNKQGVLSYIAGLTADGGTNILSALQLALEQQSSSDSSEQERIRQVIFITDGSVGNETQLFAYINQHIQQSRLFTVGIGSAPNSYFMTEAARAGKGTFTYIGSVASVKGEMQALFAKLANPVLADLSVNFNKSVEVYPRRLPDLYKGEPIMISYRADQPLSNLTVSGDLKSQHWQTSLSLQNGADSRGLDVLWARRKIAQLDRDKVFGGDHQALNQQIEDVAMAHHIVSSMTSLVAVDVTPSAQAISQDALVKLMPPKGAQMGNLPKTATPAQLQHALAWIFLGIGLCIAFFTRKV